MNKTLDKFTKAYIEAALWSSTTDDGKPLDDDYSINDIDPESIIRMDQDCQIFQYMGRDLLDKAKEKGRDEEEQGHDFWMTRCGHGVGFWDRGLDEVGEELTEICHQFGEVNLYVGDTNIIHCEMG